jgi:subtilase family serine protease
MIWQAKAQKRQVSVRAAQHSPAAKLDKPRSLIEPLEPRQMLSASHHHHHNAVAQPLALPITIAPPQDGYSPAQIRHAYGFDQVGLTGAGQTIAIVDAYNTPNIKNDLAVFNAQFGLPAVNLTVVNQHGGLTNLPPVNAGTTGWSGETALDVEWAHAIAPAANIILVEANSATRANLMAAVDVARHIPGVSAISMSWGSVINIAESPSEFQDDLIFTTPAGHNPITFVAATGDSTFQLPGPPAISPNVLAVGGTSLLTDAQTGGPGNYISEGSWNETRPPPYVGPLGGGGTGGFSDIEPMPYYQAPVLQAAAALGMQGSPRRAIPDVSYLGDPTSDGLLFDPGDPNANPPRPPGGSTPDGYAIYDADGNPFGVAGGWGTVGGTSAGSPQWAALIALANQQRVAAGKSTLDGFTQTLPALYSVYRTPGAADFATYTNVFHDVDDNDNTLVHAAIPGYDIGTGLGSPKVPAVIQLLFNATTATNTTPVAGPGTSPAPAGTFITGTVISALPITVTPGGKTKLKVKLTNVTSGGVYDGPVTINVFASTSPTLAGSTAVATVQVTRLKLRNGKSKKLNLKFAFPANLPAGDYFFSVTTDTSAMSTPSA